MQISKCCYVIYGLVTISPWVVNAGFIVGNKKTLIVDTGTNYLSAQTIFGYAKSVKPENELIVINTEPHFDHVGGNCFFKEMNIDIYGHKDINRTDIELRETISAYNESITDEYRKEIHEENLIFLKTKVVNPNLKIESDFNIDLGEINAEVFLTPGHTKMNLSIYIPYENVVFCGDTLISGYYPNMEDNTVENLKSWLSSINKISSCNPKIIVPGHGEILQGKNMNSEIIRIKTILSNSLGEL